MREQGGQLAGAGVVAVAVSRCPRQARQPAQPAADQAAQQVGVGFVVALREAAVADKPGLHPVKLLLADEGRDLGYQDPFVAWRVPPGSWQNAGAAPSPSVAPARRGGASDCHRHVPRKPDLSAAPEC